MAMETVSRSTRMEQYDLLRVIAAFSVVVLHCVGQIWYELPVTGREWQIADAWDALFRFGVPVFVMISGALFLGRDIDVRHLYRHNIFRLLLLYLIWSGAYGLYECKDYNWQETGWQYVVVKMLNGKYHLWFLPMLIGIYMLLPILRSWVKSAGKRNIEYFLALFFFLQILPWTVSALGDIYLVEYAVKLLLGSKEIGMACSYIGYFIWGYYLAHYNLPARWHRVIYVCAVPSALLNVFLGRHLSLQAGQPLGVLYDSYGIFTFVIVTALFLFFTNVMSKVRYGRLTGRIIREMSDATLGVYVMHVGLLEIWGGGGTALMRSGVIGIPLAALCCFAVCSIVAAGLRRIPLIGRYLC